MLTDFDGKVQPLPGVRNAAHLEAFIEQLVESIHRIRYIDTIKARPISADCADPQKECFDPIRAALVHQRAGNEEEAFWLVFLFVHFVVRYRMYLESPGLAANTYLSTGLTPFTRLIPAAQQLAAVRRLAHEAADAGLLSPELGH